MFFETGNHHSTSHLIAFRVGISQFGEKSVQNHAVDADFSGHHIIGKETVPCAVLLSDFHLAIDGKMLGCICGDAAVFAFLTQSVALVTLSGKYAKLCEAFKAAYAAAEEHKNDDDGGTSNFDKTWIHLRACEELRVAAAAKQAGLQVYKGRFQRVMVYFVEPPFGGQGFRRTNQTEAMCRVMKELGYDAGMYYRMD